MQVHDYVPMRRKWLKYVKGNSNPGVGGRGRRQGVGREMTQTLYARMNK
jgi:hypothetical protein